MGLARLCKSIPPLYKLMQGVAEALGGLRWVMILTILVLYAGAIVFTTMVSENLVGSSDADEEEDALESFGTVARSLYSLFRIMNGEPEPAEDLSKAMAGKLMLVGFIICSNWAILAILTSVVSDNMISSSAAIARKEEKARLEVKDTETNKLLLQLFKEVDVDGSGTIEENEWKSRVEGDARMLETLCAAAEIEKRDMVDAFNAVSGSDPQVRRKAVIYEELVTYLVKDSRIPADKRSVLKMRSQLECLEESHTHTGHQINTLDQKLDRLTNVVVAVAQKLDQTLDHGNGTNRLHKR